jgi:ATP-dependent DNA helicase DinG
VPVEGVGVQVPSSAPARPATTAGFFVVHASSPAAGPALVAFAVATSSFPFKTYRSGQREAIDAAREAFTQGKRFVVIEAPTGSGKSAIAVTLAREAASSFLLTAQKILQDQYVRDFPDLALMKGRANYHCLVAPTHAAAAPCIAGRRFPQCDECPYFTAKDQAAAAGNTTLNYAYFLAELNYSGGFGPRELLVLDEAHNAEAALMGFVQVTVSDVALARAGLAERIPFVQDELGYFDFVDELLPRLSGRGRELELELRQSPSQEVELSRLQTKQWLDNQASRLRLLLDSLDDDLVDWTVERRQEDGGQVLTFKPVRVASFAEPLLFGFAKRVLMLSATILDPPTYLRSLGIDPEEAAVISVESDFPVENRPVVVRPAARLTRHYLERELPRLVAAVSRVLDDHANEKGVIHAHSYRIARHLSANLPREQRARLVTHDNAGGRDAALDAHVRSSEPTVLLTPSMTEGIDLAGELSRWQVICKIPYPYLGDPQIAQRRELDPAWYDWRTCLTVVQAYGRSVRSRDDFAVTYVLDADFPAFLRRQRGRLPAWFLEAVTE